MSVFYLYFCYWVLGLCFTLEQVRLQSLCLSSQFAFSASFYHYILPSGYSQRMRDLPKWFRYIISILSSLKCHVSAQEFYRGYMFCFTYYILNSQFLWIAFFSFKSSKPEKDGPWDSFASHSDIITLFSRYQTQSVMELKVSLGPNTALYLRWRCC